MSVPKIKNWKARALKAEDALGRLHQLHRYAIAMHRDLLDACRAAGAGIEALVKWGAK